MYENSGSQFSRTTTGIHSVPDTFDEWRFVTTFSTILEITQILCSLKLVLERKRGKEILESSRLEFFEKNFSKQICFIKYRRQHLWTIEQRMYSRFIFIESTISNFPKVSRAQFLESDGLFCFISKFASYASLAASRSLLQRLIACVNFPLDSKYFFCWYKQKS